MWTALEDSGKIYCHTVVESEIYSRKFETLILSDGLHILVKYKD